MIKSKVSLNKGPEGSGAVLRAEAHLLTPMYSGFRRPGQWRRARRLLSTGSTKASKHNPPSLLLFFSHGVCEHTHLCIPSQILSALHANVYICTGIHIRRPLTYPQPLYIHSYVYVCSYTCRQTQVNTFIISLCVSCF